MITSHSDLSNLLTVNEPLGPILHERIVDEFFDDLVDDEVTAFKEIASKPHTLLLGRKGAGKSALITDLRLQMQRAPAPADHRMHAGHRRRQDFVLSVLTWQHFHKIVLNVGRHFANDELLADLVPPEHFVELWHEILWHEIIQHFYDASYYADSREILAPVAAYVNATITFEGDPKTIHRT